MTNRSPEAPHGMGRNAVAVLVVCIALGGCGISGITAPFSSGGGLFGSSNPNKDTGQKAGWGATVSEASLMTSARNGDITGSIGAPNGCPAFSVAPGGKNITIRSNSAESPKDVMSVLHRGEITKTARECASSPQGIVVKYGFAGRVLLGPQGKSGNITLPVKVTVVDDLRRTVKSETLRLSVAVPSGQTSGYFSMVRTITVPIGPGMTAKSYQVNVAFDHSARGAS
jgi:hypothetical protein